MHAGLSAAADTCTSLMASGKTFSQDIDTLRMDIEWGHAHCTVLKGILFLPKGCLVFGFLWLP